MQSSDQPSISGSRALVLLGATGDLAKRMLWPSLLHLDADGLLPEGLALFGVARRQGTDETFKAGLRADLSGRDGIDAGVLDRFLSRIHYVTGDVTVPEGAAHLAEVIGPVEQLTFFFALSPSLYAAACANLLGLNEQQTRVALGIGASRTGALFANNGTMTKCTHPGNAGRMGVEAAMLAADGFTANEAIFEAGRGYVETLFGHTVEWDALLGGLGHEWNLQKHGFNIKRYPAQIAMQWATESVVLLREKNNLRADEVEWLELEVSSRRPGLSRPAPATGLDGKFSFEYVAAVALTQDQVGIDSFSDAVRFSAPVEAALKKIRLKPNPDISTSTLETWAQARAGLKDGRVLVERCDAYRGCSRNPITREAHLVKVRDCMRGVLPEAKMERLIGLVDGLHELKDARVLVRALVGE